MVDGELLKRIMHERTGDIVHSSGYAKVQGSRFGADSTESFATRRRIDANRTVIRGYSDSKIVNEAHNANYKAKKYGDESDGNKDKGESKDKQKQNNVKEESMGYSKPEHSPIRIKDKYLKKENNTDKRRSFVSGRPSLSSQRTTTPPIRRNPGISR